MAWYHQWSAKLLEHWPWLYQRLTVMTAGELPPGVPGSPWTPMEKDPFEAKLLFVTTGGAHGPEARPFDMSDSRGDTSFRWVDSDQEDFEITHDYYDHSDADDDINCLYPLPLAREVSEAGLIGSLADRHLSFMGHIEDPLLPEFVNESLPAMWQELEDRPDLVVLSPG